MKKYKSFFFLIVLSILFILAILLFYTKINNKESFVPKIKQMFRPHMRQVRIYSDEYSEKIKRPVEKIFKMFGLQFA